MCRFRVVFPPSAGEFDQISIILSKADYVNVIVTETLNYKDQNYKEFSLSEGVSYTATWPNEVFIVVISNAPITQVLAAPEEEEEPVAEEPTPAE